jgi:hypothetical protein
LAIHFLRSRSSEWCGDIRSFAGRSTCCGTAEQLRLGFPPGLISAQDGCGRKLDSLRHRKVSERSVNAEYFKVDTVSAEKVHSRQSHTPPSLRRLPCSFSRVPFHQRVIFCQRPLLRAVSALLIDCPPKMTLLESTYTSIWLISRLFSRRRDADCSVSRQIQFLIVFATKGKYYP